MERDEQKLQPDQHEQNGVEALVQERPKGAYAAARGLADGERPTAVPDDQPGDDHGYGGGCAKGAGEAVPAQHQGQRQQDFQLIVVNIAEQAAADITHAKAEQGAADHFPDQQQ